MSWLNGGRVGWLGWLKGVGSGWLGCLVGVTVDRMKKCWRLVVMFPGNECGWLNLFSGLVFSMRVGSWLRWLNGVLLDGKVVLVDGLDD